jgi:salicylate hydroxylase
MSGLRVLIVGAGIGGCAAALALRREGCVVDVFEQAVLKVEVGAGIQISPNASRLLYRYGLAKELDAIGVKPAAAVLRRWQDGRELSREDLGVSAETAYGAPYYHVHRADLLAVLSAAIPSDRMHFGQRCVAIRDNGSIVRAEFADGSFTEADLLIGADGIHSFVRTHLFGHEHPRFSGNVAFRGLAPADRIADLGIEVVSSNWLGPGGHFVHYFVGGGRYLNFVAVSEQSGWERESWTDRADAAEAHARYAGWHPQIHAILDSVESIFKWALFDREPLPCWSRGRVALLGDACHAMLPYMAQGAAQAIEDGAALAAALRGTRQVEDALALYEGARKPRTTKVQMLARRNSIRFHLPDGPAQQERDAALTAMRSGQNPSGLSQDRIMLFGHDAEVLQLPA